MFQEYWDAFLIGPFLFFAGLVGIGMATTSFLRLKRYELRYEVLSYLFLGFIILALLLVMADLTRPPTVMMFSMLNSFITLRYNFLLPVLRGEITLRFSWMALGIVMLIVALLLVAIWAVPHLLERIRVILPQRITKPLSPILTILDKLAGFFLAQKWFYYLCMVVGVVVTLYSGFLISEAKAVPFWNITLWGIPAIPVIWIFSATAGALAFIRMYHLDHEHIVHTTEKYGVVAELGEILFIFLYLYTALNSPSIAARESAYAVMWGEVAPVFWGVVIGLGILTPLALAAVSRFYHSPVLIYAGCVAGLFGALALRTMVVYVGIPEPL
ncbi:NrfD/PsrC family molybdoenzyme membrane anchor subunit [Pyrobaculum ferrireducens]|uniref:Polysulfide reductase, NrfD n=1 Tax=Pyrobaculum ferrireducens TaxID=1104324 RepID=G7VGI8_9CREN|nr:NrfD/PsrC family molybdoenzyme membrane anchor subunit [Pyrobaculum ferrireducens]AET33088.1 Polysulfide reductase, NrfD [Pyrobaculum ferrireducens]